ncbi:deoxyribonuclease HsdR [Clostridium carboxidivorans P7]|uniref:2-alkenal reductase n=1 Tax=Clostridium carboxidivorans P7 TaxID=536227 RepID=C6PYW1_9CLOT|nr:trypsin-like peptidase domain-containing protein [Clostridium carboxidivorans]AKN33681.1 deoxyribonuclease HsdR [Clostridium carboxidivorans P7]EET85592.1 2-alkenal reductase [Clostridium carboxidivorans P7]EFG86722.1 trypsin [Clostridium carboxidivorans P7]
MDNSNNEKNGFQLVNTNNSSEGKDFNNSNNNYNFQNKFFKHKGKIKRGLVSYVIVGLICSVVAGTASTAVTLYYLPNSNFFKNTPLYQNLKQGSGTTATSTNYINASTVSTKGSLTVAQIAQKVGPAVVGVSTTGISQNDYGFAEKQEGMGSGIIINSEGYILTNFHVINGAQQVKVILNDKKEVSAKIVNYDQNMDLAIVKVTDSSVKMPAVAELGSSEALQVGDPVVAIGNPLGKELLGSVTTGVISAKNREIQESTNGPKQTFLQTDAAINAGNSGGALVNSQGQVIGINTAKINGSGVEGLGFAIPMDSIKPKIDSLLKPILKIGISCKDISSDVAKQNNVPEGVAVIQVQEFSPAEKAGLQAGDIITKFDGKSVKSVDSMNTIKSKHKSGDEISLEVYRDGSTKSLKLKLSE